MGCTQVRLLVELQNYLGLMSRFIEPDSQYEGLGGRLFFIDIYHKILKFLKQEKGAKSATRKADARALRERFR